MGSRKVFKGKLYESVTSVLPITLIVSALCFTFVPVSNDLMLSFIIGAFLLMLGMGLFNIGVEIGMSPIGSYVGSKITKSRKLSVIIIVSFILGVAITVAEPDLQVLATTVPHIDTWLLIGAVGIGVGIFLCVGMLRIFFKIKLKWLLIAFYAIVFGLAAISDLDYLSVAFDSGGVTTGPMTVPFIMAMGVGVASIRSDKDAEADSFGLVALSSAGPIVAVMLLGLIYTGVPADSGFIISSFATTVELSGGYVAAIPKYILEVLLALAPIAVFFLIFQVFFLKLRRIPFYRILIGILYTFVGLVLFLVGVNVGFGPLGYVLGESIAGSQMKFILIPIAMIMGWFMIQAEPAVHILNKQVEEISAGTVSEKAMGISLSVAIALATGLAMVRVLTNIPLLYFLIPGYIISLALSFFVPQLFTAIAFDSGGVASGPMTATFMLPLAIGASTAAGGNPLTDAFGLVALVAMMPLITVQVMGVISVLKTGTKRTEPIKTPYGEDEIIELWEMV